MAARYGTAVTDLTRLDGNIRRCEPHGGEAIQFRGWVGHRSWIASSLRSSQ
jgi:hypothetical protein